MSVRVEVAEGETLARAVRRLRMRVREAYGRKYYKTRPGCYRKPSVRRRDQAFGKKRMARTRGRSGSIHLDMPRILKRGDPFQSRK